MPDGGGAGGIADVASIPVQEAALNLDRSTVNLGSLDIGAAGVATVTLTNVGGAPTGALVITTSAGVTASGCSGSLPGGASCTLTISATPTAPGSFSGTVSITAYPGAITPLVISVITTFHRDLFSVSPPAIDLGDIAAGVPAPKSTITVSTSSPLSDLAIASRGPDVAIDAAATTCTTTLAVQASCVVVFDFLATTCGDKSDAIVIGGGGPAGKVITVPITARAQASSKLVISPDTRQAFVAGSTVTFGVANVGDTPTGLLTAGVKGAYAFDFSITDNTCLVLAPLASCTISIAYHPVSVDAGASTIANLVVTDTAICDTSVTVELVDTSYWASALALYPSTTEIPSVEVGTTGVATVFTVVNGGDPSGTLRVGVSSKEFVIANDTCSGATLAKNGSCTFSLALKPVSAGPPKTATLTVSDGVSTVQRTLTSIGVPILASLPGGPRQLDFGTVPVNQIGPTVTITVRNGGLTSTGPLSLTEAGDFSVFPIGRSTCSAPLGPGEVCYVDVSFAPTVAQPESATIVVTDGNTSLTLLLTGTGTL